MWNILTSRKLALWALLGLLLPLTLSAFLPSELTLPEREWAELSRQSPFYFGIASRLATPYLVKTPFFAAVSLLLFLSTCACTVQRVLWGLRGTSPDFSRDRSFSFSREVPFPLSPEEGGGRITRLLASTGWRHERRDAADALVLSGVKGRSGFWGSIVFHVGLLGCFLAGPATYLTALTGELVLTEGVALPLKEGVSLARGKGATLPEARASLHDLRGVYYKGRFKSDFGGVMKISDARGEHELRFEVNRPVEYQGLQFSLHQFGFAPRLVIERSGAAPFDFYLNLRHPREGDFFEVGGGVRALVIFFPDFIREGGKIGTKTEEPLNPVTMVRLYRGETEIGKGLVKPGESAQLGGYRVTVPDYRHWATLVVTRDAGVPFTVFGFVVCVAGLLIRFASNERLVEFELRRQGEESLLTVKGYSRYYPAFLEKEVDALAEKLIEDGVT
ncbi:MAG TPA: hypothetical protein DCZ75_18090 [Geobacter sp.]|nr:hypothetical protein [Geobacter sp.]